MPEDFLALAQGNDALVDRLRDLVAPQPSASGDPPMVVVRVEERAGLKVFTASRTVDADGWHE
eukprot:7202617-Prymnesium_polylepis.1